MTTDNQILKVCGLVKSFEGRRVVDGLSFAVNPGEIVGLLGPNGAGKTTAFYMTMGLVRPDEGQVFFNGQEVTRIAMHQRARMGMGYLAQEPSIFSGLTVEQNILSILESLSLSKEERKKRLQELLSELHLEPLAKKRAGALSGGEKRRLEITRALATKPTCLLLDEPFANIDPRSIQEVQQIIVHLAEKGISILITDHNAREIFSVVDRSYLVTEGRVLVSGSTEELTLNEEAKRLYFGGGFSENFAKVARTPR